MLAYDAFHGQNLCCKKAIIGPHPQYGWEFPEEIPEKFRKDPGNALRERFLEFPSRVRLGCPKPYNSRHLRLPEHFQNSLPPSTAGGASFFRSGSGEGLPEPVMEFPAVLGVFLNHQHVRETCSCTRGCSPVQISRSCLVKDISSVGVMKLFLYHHVTFWE